MIEQRISIFVKFRISGFFDILDEMSHLPDCYLQDFPEQIGVTAPLHQTYIISMLSEAGLQDTTIKKIIGHSGAMSLTVKVYMHLDVQILVDAINITLEE